MSELNGNINKIIKLQRTCTAIGRYYQQMGKTDYYSINTPHQGKFSKWFEEEELDRDDLKNDFSHIDECCYLQFDDDFPFPPNIIKYKEQIQFLIMQYCFNHAQSPSLQQINAWYSNEESKHSKKRKKNKKYKYTTDDTNHTMDMKYDNDNDNHTNNKAPMPTPAFPSNNSSERLKRKNSVTQNTEFEEAKILPISEASHKRKAKQVYRGSKVFQNPLLPCEPQLMHMQKSKSYITDDVDLNYTAHIKYNRNHKPMEYTCIKNIKKCTSIANMKYCLRLYRIWINNNKTGKNKKHKGIYQIFYQNNTKITDILSDFHHIIYIHNDTFDEMYEELTNDSGKKCDVLKCDMVKRNYRDKLKMAMDFNRSKMYYGYEASQEVNMQQLLDKIHCHLYHSYDLGLRIHNREFEHINKSLKHIKSIIHRKKKNINKIYDKLHCNKYKLELEERKQSENGIGIFTFGEQCYFGMRVKHKDLKEEMLHNITKYQWRDLYYKAREYMNVKNSYEYKEYKIKHLLSIMIYCNYGKWLKIKTNYNTYGNLTKLIIETVEMCNVSERTMSFYICLHKQITLTPATIIQFKTLVSLTSNSIVGINFCGMNDGLLLELQPYTPNNEIRNKCFDCRFISDFGNEYEVLCCSSKKNNIMQSQFEIINMIDTCVGFDYSMYVILIKILHIIHKDNGNGNDNDIAIDIAIGTMENTHSPKTELHNYNIFTEYISNSLDRFCLNRPYYMKQDIIDLLLNIFFLPDAITKYTKKDYDIQCYPNNCGSFQSCVCVLRIIHILKIYQSILNSPYWLKLPILPFVTFNRNGIQYDHQQIVCDFSHIMTYHQHQIIQSKQEQITVFHFVESEIILDCKYRNISNSNTTKNTNKKGRNDNNNNNNKVCVSFERHCRNKSYRDIEKEQFLKLFYSSNANDIEHELDIESELDRIHSYFLHSLCKYNLTAYNQSEYEHRKNVIQQNEQLRIRYRAGTIVDMSDMGKNISEDDVDREYLLNNILMNEKIENEHKTSTDNDENIENNKIDPLGKFYFQSIPQVEPCLHHIQATFNNIKEEVLHNKLEPLTISDWNEVLRKSRKQTKDWNKKKHKVGYKQAATLKQIMTIKLYTDYDKLQHELKKSFRIIPDKLHKRNKYNITKEMRSLRTVLSNFYHWRDSMICTIAAFQDFIGYESLYHGVNPSMILCRLNTLSTFWGPLSSTTNKHVASTFATNKGMVIQFCSKYPRSTYCYQFDASIISDYPEENERIIGFMYCRIRMVYSDIYNLQHYTISNLDKTNKRYTNFNRLSDDNIKHNQTYMNWYYWTLRLFTNGIYSMSAQIEPFIMEILNKTKKVMKQYNIQKVEDIKKYKNNISKNKNIRILVSHLLKYLFSPSSKQVIYLDDISFGLRTYFLINGDSTNHNDKNWRIDYTKLLSLFPNLQCIYLYNHYVFNNNVLRDIIAWLRDKTNNKYSSQIEIIKFIYFDYKHLSDVMCDIQISIQIQLNALGWSIRKKRLKNDNGYTVQLKCDNFNN